MRVIAWRNVSLAGLLALLGCGPVQYITTVTQQAASEVAAAKSAGAEKFAPYEYTAATEYLHKAREEEGYSDHQAAVRFGRLSRDLAIKAKRISLEKAGAPGAETPVDSPETENPIEQVRQK